MHAACVTPFNEDGTLDEGAYRVLLDRLAAAGVGAYLALVGTGEAQLMRDSEIRRSWEIGVERLKGKVPVYACGIGPTDTAHTINLANEAGAVGADAVYIYPPRPLPAPTPQGREVIERFLNEFLDKIRYPVHIANNPFIVGYSIPVDLLEKVVDTYSHVAAVVNAEGNTPYVVRMLGALRSKTAVIEVLTPQMFTNLALGGHGALCIECNIAPHLCRSVIDAFEAGDSRGVAASFARVLKLHEGISKYPNPTGVKAALSLLGLPGGYPRLPYLLPDQAGRKEIQAVLEKLEIGKTDGIVSLSQ